MVLNFAGASIYGMYAGSTAAAPEDTIFTIVKTLPSLVMVNSFYAASSIITVVLMYVAIFRRSRNYSLLLNMSFISVMIATAIEAIFLRLNEQFFPVSLSNTMIFILCAHVIIFITQGHFLNQRARKITTGDI